LLLRHRFIANKLSIGAGPAFYHYRSSNERNAGRILDYGTQYGLDSIGIHAPKTYGGGRLQASFSSLDNALLPVRGLRWTADLTAMQPLSTEGHPITRAQSDIALYAPLSDNHRFVLSLRAGGGHIFSRRFEYFQALTVGANNYLRGYRKNRFTGSSSAYGSAELRARLAQVRSRFLPGELGLVGFGDRGRVWLRDETSPVWHTSAGGGIYFAPYNAVLISVLTAFSKEERLMNISIGTGLSFTF
jgi:outer membrane protein assembly factor BamA